MRHRPICKAQRQIHVCRSTLQRQVYRCHLLAAPNKITECSTSRSSLARHHSTLSHDYGLRSSRLTLLGHKNGIRAKDGRWRRLQHAQAQHKDEGDDEEPQSLVFGDVDGEVERDSLNVVAEDANIDSSSQATPLASRASARLLQNIKARLPYAATVIQFQISETAEPMLCLEVKDEINEVTCTRTTPLSESTQDGLARMLVDLTEEYVNHIESHVKQPNRHRQDLSSHSIRRFRELLDLEPISIDCRPMVLSQTAQSTVHLFRAQAYAGHEPVGRAQVWTDPEAARRLARLSADVDILKRAEQAGIDVAKRTEQANAEFDTTLPKVNGGPKTERKNSRDDLQRTKDPRQYTASISRTCISQMLYTLHWLRKVGLPDSIELQPFKSRSHPKMNEYSHAHLDSTSSALREWFGNRRISLKLMAILNQRRALPIRQIATSARIRNMVEAHDVVVLVSETGSGKTTQLPQILLEEAIEAGTGAECNIICTQPRRIAATSVAHRVAQELGTEVGGHVGYQVRFDHRNPSELGSILYSTAGVLLKQLQDDSERVLNQASHIVVDEIHERDLTVDILLAFLRDLMRTRKSKGLHFPKIILMSATMRSIDFEQYFAETHNGFTPRVASITIPGRAYSVTANMLDDLVPALVEDFADDRRMMTLLKDSQEYLQCEDEFAASQNEVSDAQAPSDELPQTNSTSQGYDDLVRTAAIPYSLMTATVVYTLKNDTKGDILIFLPGMKEIDTLTEALTDTLKKMGESTGSDWSNQDKIRMFKLHSALYETNAKVFEAVPEGCRRIILATNIAQTSITLPGVVHVIDSGKRRELVYDQINRKSDFMSTWIDKATSLQRRGRAGRVQSGQYWAMYSQARFESMPDKASPEILTSDLTTSSLILKSHSNSIDLQQFFAGTIDAPDTAVVAACIQELKEMGMLTAKEEITPLGKFCSEFPLHPAKARGLLMGILFRCFDPLLILASHDANTPLVHSSLDRREALRSMLEFAGVSDDDRYVFVSAFRAYENAICTDSIEGQAALKHKYVKADIHADMHRVARQLCGILDEYRFIDPKVWKQIEAGSRVLAAIPPGLNENSQRTALFKALALSVVDTNIAVWNEEEKAWLAKDIKCMMRPDGVNTKQSLRLLEREPHRQPGEVIGFSAMVQNLLASPRPFLTETSSITPLVAMLFGGPLIALDDRTVEIDGWLRYRIEVGSNASPEKNDDLDVTRPATIILEYRKAIERVITYASSTLVNTTRVSGHHNRTTDWKARERINAVVFRLRQGLIPLLEADADHWDETLRVRNEQKARKEAQLRSGRL